MAEEEERHDEVIVRFDYSGESIVLAGSDDDPIPGAHPGEARIEVDPLVEAFARSPYDPVIGAMMMGRATGEVIARPPRLGWMRLGAAFLALFLIGQLAAFVYFWIAIDGLELPGSLPSFFLSLAQGAGGILLLRRLLRR